MVVDFLFFFWGERPVTVNLVAHNTSELKVYRNQCIIETYLKYIILIYTYNSGPFLEEYSGELP